MRDIPERLEWRCMLPIDVLRVLDDATMSVVVCYNSTGLDVRKEIRQDGLRGSASSRFQEWLDLTDSHFVELVGGLHGRGNFYGFDRTTDEIRSLYHDMKDLGYAVEDDE
jgi:hypothetical protein